MLKTSTQLMATVCRGVAARLNRVAASVDRFNRQPSLEWFTVESGILTGTQMFGDVNSWWTPFLRTCQFEQFMYDAMLTLSIECTGKTVWDIGAHFGYHTLRFAAMVGSQGSVHAFEPNPNNILRIQQQLTRNPELASRIALHQIALADTNGPLPFRYSQRGDEADLGHLATVGVPTDVISPTTYADFETTIVKACTIDAFLADHPDALPQIIKLDVEGAEFSVLCGANHLLEIHHPTWLIEVHNIRAMHNAATHLAYYGYRTHLLDDPYASGSKYGSGSCCK